ncbi:hypothetical protein PLICRDRAFT_46491 [Plicaturopsis crispa FD-325 SS-3]|uniref:G-protein coupled receptors family 1 profile domain-containing protein n=1 Tax=Plicaturopsis crispa FD-325 SS-3 TaxID=944288 RepID=A0A0C9SQX3_PLICR|nr:hypothetical protein PLICRDRAFT_46491 [Plicaturopsis crispa FD-325 SS-3]
MSNITAPPLPPPGTNWIAALQPAVGFLLIGTIFSSMLVPILLALFFFSTRAMRRTLMFSMNVFALLIGLAMGVLNVYSEAYSVLRPSDPLPSSSYGAFASMTAIMPWIVECILLLRVKVVYPLRTTSRLTLIAIYTPAVLLKLGRLINMAVYLNTYIEFSRTATTPIVAGEVLWNTLPNTRIEWGLQVLDNGYLSFIFLRRIIRKPQASEGVVRGSRLSARLRGLFLIAVSNFVFPCLFGLIQLILLLRTGGFLLCTYFNMVNNYINIIGVVFATVWSTGTRWASAEGLTSEYVLSQTGTTTLPSTTESPHGSTPSNSRSYRLQSLARYKAGDEHVTDHTIHTPLHAFVHTSEDRTPGPPKLEPIYLPSKQTSSAVSFV